MSMNSSPVTTHGSSIRIQVHAQPGAKRTELVGRHGDALKIRVQSPPLEGRANDELLRFLADTLGVPRSSVSLVRGEKSRSKVFEVASCDRNQAESILLK